MRCAGTVPRLVRLSPVVRSFRNLNFETNAVIACNLCQVSRAHEHAQAIEEQLDTDLGDHDAQRSRRQLTEAMEEQTRLQSELANAQESIAKLQQDAAIVAVETGALEATRSELAVKTAQLAEAQLAEEAASEKAVALEHALAEGRQALSESQRLLFVAQQESAARTTADATRHAEEVVAMQTVAREKEAEMSTMHTKQKQLEAELVQCKAGVKQAVDTVAKTRKSCEGSIAAAREETNKVRREACHCVSENERLHSIVDEKDRQLALLQETVESLAGKPAQGAVEQVGEGDARETLSQQCVVLMGQLDHAHAAHCELERRLGEMQGALQGQVLEFSALQREASAVLEKLADAQQELGALRKLKATQEEQTRAARMDIASLQRELEEVKQSLSFQRRRADAAEAECTAQKREAAEQRAAHFAALKQHVADHEGATRELKLRLLTLEHEAGSNIATSDDILCASTEKDSLFAKVSAISTHIRESAEKIQAELATAGHPQHDQALRHEAWRARTDAQLSAFESAVVAQARSSGQLQLANATSVLLCSVFYGFICLLALVGNISLCLFYRCDRLQRDLHVAQDPQLMASEQLLAAQATQKKLLREVERLKSQLESYRSVEQLQLRGGLVAALQERVDELRRGLDATLQRLHEAEADGERRSEDAETLRQQLGRCQRELAIATTGAHGECKDEDDSSIRADLSVAPGTPPQSSEARVGRMRDWFEAELARMVSAGTTDERLLVRTLLWLLCAACMLVIIVS